MPFAKEEGGSDEQRRISKEVSKKAKVSQKATADVVAAVLETIEKTVSKGKKLLWLVSVHLKLEKELQELAVTRKPVQN